MITTGHPLSRAEWIKAVAELETRAEAAERQGLRHTARSWRDLIANLQLWVDE